MTRWDEGIAGPDTYTAWDGATETTWDVIGRGFGIVWQSVVRSVRWL